MVTSKAKCKAPPDSSRVYSYIRFSTPEQALGDSERRQLEITRQFAERKGLVLDESLQPDRGISGFHGAHRKRGVLGAFLKQVQSEAVPRGSILVVENADRLSREGVETTLRTVIFKLWDFGIILQTLSPEETYEPGCGDNAKFLALWIYLSRARDESLRKSERVRAARNEARRKAREDGKILTARCPAWLGVIDGKFEPISEATKAIKTIFDLRRKGISPRQIAKRLNGENGWKASENGWRASYIQKILSNPAVIGQYQPYTCTDKGRVPVGDPIENYYSQIIMPATFYAVKELLSANKGKGGRNGKASNLLKHLVKCPYCGGSMYFKDHGASARGGRSFVCDNARRNVCCERHWVRYDEVESLVLENCKGLRPEAVLPDPDAQDKLCQSLRERIVEQQAERTNIQSQIDNLMQNLSGTSEPSMVKRYEKQIEKLEQQAQAIEDQAESDQAELKKTEHSRQSLERWQGDLTTLQKALKKKDDVELRMRMQAHLKELIEKVEVYAVGFQEKYLGEGYDQADLAEMQALDSSKSKVLSVERRRELRRPSHKDCCETLADYCYYLIDEYIPGETGKKYFGDFVRQVVKRRMTKEGRFCRIHFTTGNWADVVPEGSIASGRRLSVNEDGRPGWEYIQPDLETLRQQYEASTGGKRRKVVNR